MIQRIYLDELIRRVSEKRKFIQVLYGARQIGKTTMIHQLESRVKIPVLFFSADDRIGVEQAWLREIWTIARKTLREQTRGSAELLLVVDEIQKIPNWSESVKREWDSDTREKANIKVVLLGSSSLLIQKGLSESLAGRFEAFPIPHWSFGEMREAFGWNVEQFIWFGGYPGAAELIDNEERWRDYICQSLVETSIARDVLMMSHVEKPALLRRLFEIGCNYSAQILSLTKIQGELQERGNLTTLAGYLALLQSAGLLGSVEKFAGDIIRKRASKPKFQVFNNALFSAQSKTDFERAREDGRVWGRFAESAIGAHLLNFAMMKKFDLYYWNENNREVDFVLERRGKLIALEVKTGVDSANLGMEIFAKKFNPLAIYTIGTNGIPIEEFLSSDPTELF